MALVARRAVREHWFLVGRHMLEVKQWEALDIRGRVDSLPTSGMAAPKKARQG